jgi:hypothetical protein
MFNATSGEIFGQCCRVASEDTKTPTGWEASVASGTTIIDEQTARAMADKVLQRRLAFDKLKRSSGTVPTERKSPRLGEK